MAMASRKDEPIAIVGSACRFAGDVNSPSKLWELLKEPKDLQRQIPDTLFNPTGFYHTESSYHGHSNVKDAYLTNQDLGVFDADFFGIKPIEAKAIDPQQRFLMEVVYEGLESAGMALDDLKGSDTGVYVGVMFHDYGAMLLRDLQDIPTYYATGTGASILSNRVSYFFDWHGPSITIDTACSSSLVAVHMAVQALRAGDAKMAIAAGSNLILGPENFIIESKLKMLSPTGRSRMWDEQADGYARGDGVAALVLKPLSVAIADNDHIECIIRETALNQDGASSGITMPNASAQEELIRGTYVKAGLDLSEPMDRPQFFEAHGTGTPAGDPTEAEAVYRSLSVSQRGDEPLYVGSIKTVLGHTEGTAGIAAIMKASMALQNATIPPNMLLQQLSSRVAPFYKNIEIPQTAKPWPKTDGPRRSSVNSFGFGGANAHAILEAYDRPVKAVSPTNGTVFTPFVFSASSEHSLRASLSAYAEALGTWASDTSPADLAWTLRERRSVLSHRAQFSASSLEELRDKIEATLARDSSSAAVGTRGLSLQGRAGPKLLGIFTGQGAQYPRMGAELIEKSHNAREILQRLEASLAQLPDGPDWSLTGEMLAPASSSRVHEAAVSQPLCTAVQILQVDLLRRAGVTFDVVVGHSSGEIAAAYAAGYLTASDAMRVAYYRGVCLGLASSPNGNGKSGAMLAVGTSLEDMEGLCSDDLFAGRISVAACNSSSSVTASGDEDAILELQQVLNDEDKFNRLLKVDRAYHSSHMLPCYDTYVESLRSCGVAPQSPEGACAWYSSVQNREIGLDMGLGDTYWAENMTRPVLFHQAVQSALAAITCHLAIEVGAHPALQGPARQTIENVVEKELPYVSLLRRGMDAVEAVSTGLGDLWSLLGKAHVDLSAYEQAMTGPREFSLVKGLPKYAWNHRTRYWHESRASRKMRNRGRAVHPLLGDITPDSAPHHMSWRNLLRTSEMDWLEGHQVQGQVVFPASGYLASALEASLLVAASTGSAIRYIDISDFVVHQPVAFGQDDAGIESLVEMTGISQDQGKLRAHFTYSAALQPSSDDLILAASGSVDIFLGDGSQCLLPRRKPDLPHMIEVEPDRFYQALSDLGYNFSGRFRSLSELKRRHLRASCVVKLQPSRDNEEPMAIHPAELDAVLQSCILAYCYPYDEQLRSLHLPTTIERVRVNPSLLAASATRTQEECLDLVSSIRQRSDGQRGITGDVTLYSSGDSHAAIQIQGATYLPLGGAAEEQDRRVFSKVHWIGSRPDGLEAAREIPLTDAHRNMVLLLERIATFYLRKFQHEVDPDDPKRSEFPTKWYLNYARYITELVQSGKHKWVKSEWLRDTLDDILEASKPFRGVVDVDIMHLVGAQMPRVFRGETTILEEFRADGSVGILDRYYAEGFGLRESAQWVGRVVKQIADRHPHMNILECGAGTGSATKAIFREIGQSFHSYTYTDISAAFFENASQVFSRQRDRMIFKTFDAERDPLDQGYTPGSYDLVVAFFIIHATSDLERALRNIRKLLRPGGFLVVGEGQEGQNGVASSGFIFGTLPGWWLGAGKNEGRDLSPHVSPAGWDTLLKKTGFSGVDAKVPGSFEEILNVYHFVSQAVDDQTNFLRQPLASVSSIVPPVKKLVIVGGRTSRSADFAQGVKEIFTKRRLAAEVYSFETLLDVDFSIVDTDATVVSLCELDQPVFKGITPETFAALRSIFEDGKTLLWVTSGRLRDEPYSNMTVGFGRTAAHESPDLCLQQLDITDPQSVTSEAIAEILMRLHASKYLDSSLLWTTEPEIIIDGDARHLLSRLRPIAELNDRYNSAHRTIIRERNVESSPFALQQSVSGKPVVKQLSEWGLLAAENRAEDSIELRTTHAVSSALKTPFGYLFLVLGLGSGDSPYLALLPSLQSVTKLPTTSAVPCHMPGVPREDILLAMASHLVAFNILNPLYSGQLVIAHNPTALIAQALGMQAAAKGVRVVFTSDHTSPEDAASWITLPPYMTRLEIQEILPSQPSAFVGFSHGDQLSQNEAAIISCLPESCHTETARTLYSATGTATQCLTTPLPAGILKTLLDLTCESIKTTGSGQPTAASQSLSSLLDAEQPFDPMSIIDFTVDTVLPVQAARLDTWPVFKGKDSTYWVSGMTGALGISLCDWMINRGARNIVLTSRKPEIATEWVDAHRRRGATVMIIPCDVTSEEQVRLVHERICQELPPIAGVMNGAMVLRDVSIRNMTFEQLTDVIRPKVDGSIILDRVFYDTDLDFFVLISSINCVIGNWGQANYAAANTFMCGLAEQRRRRGLRAAAVNAGAIIGAGYMERESRRALDAIVQKLYMMKLSEEDWHQAILEAIDASRLESPHGPEITTGLSDVPFEISNAPTWYTNPKFSDFIVHASTEKNDDGSGKAPVSIQELLQECQSREHVLEVVERGFAAQLRNALQMDMTDEELMASRSSDIGLDSLVSVDIRSWFQKNLQASIPVLKIMGSGTMAELVEVAVEAMPQELMPNASINEDETEDTDSGSPAKLDTPPTEMVSSAGTSPAPTPPTAEEKTAKTTTGTLHGNVDWIAESTPPTDFSNIPRVSDRPLASPPKVFVLTGVSGLLGHHLLEHILTTTSATTVHCLAVRRLSARLRSGELPSDPRVVYHEGQLADPLLGLSQAEAAAIFDEADCVVHNGADTSHIKFYADLKASNVGSTVALARLCLPRRIPLHYVSSAGVAVYYGRPSFPEVSVTGPGSSQPAPDGSFGYGCSKWANERLLEQVHGLYGLPVAIYRPSTIIRAGRDAEGPKAQLDWVNALLHYVRKIGAAPRAVHNRGALDLVSIRSCCDGILGHVAKGRGGADEETIKYFNLVGDTVIPLDRLCEIDSAGRGKPYELLPLAEWISRATAAGLHAAVAVLIEEMESPGCAEYPRLLKT